MSGVELATTTDAETIAVMVGELLDEITAAIGTGVFRFDRTATQTRAHTWLADGTYRVLCAREGDAMVGFLAIYESRSLYAGGTFGTIPELYVRPAYRSRGIGTRLLSEACRYARSQHWTRLEVTTPPLPQFERTKAFYEREGFTVTGGRKMKVDIV